MRQDPETKVLYVSGWGRSGSTILGCVLAQLDGFFLGAELRYTWFVWTRNWSCGCGKPFRECTTWSEVLRRWGDAASRDINATEMTHLHEQGDRLIAHLRWGALPGRTSLPEPEQEQLASVEQLYRSIRSSTGCTVIVDTSKHPAYGKALGLIPTIDLYIVHLIRDPRAVAYSWLRERMLDPKAGVRFPKRKAVQSALLWNVQNLLAEILGRRRQRYLRLRYEDFVARPQDTVRALLAFVQEERADIPFIDAHSVQLDVNHAVGGNPTRFHTGTVRLKSDEEWKQRMRRSDRFIVAAVTWPLRLRYGYSGSG